MKKYLLLLLIPTLALAAGRLQNSDFMTEAELTGAGGSVSQLLNDSKIYITGAGINKTLDDAIADGDIGGGSGVPLMSKGSLLTSNGTANGEFTACADDEIIVFDAAEVNGFKCEAKPVAGGGPTVLYRVSSGSNQTISPINSWTPVPLGTVSVDIDSGDGANTYTFGRNALATVYVKTSYSGTCNSGGSIGRRIYVNGLDQSIFWLIPGYDPSNNIAGSTTHIFPYYQFSSGDTLQLRSYVTNSCNGVVLFYIVQHD